MSVQAGTVGPKGDKGTSDDKNNSGWPKLRAVPALYNRKVFGDALLQGLHEKYVEPISSHSTRCGRTKVRFQPRTQIDNFYFWQGYSTRTVEQKYDFC
jgi:hypothetical protein